MQEFADPMTSIVWDSWAEMHPQTARKLGIRDGEVAVLSTPWGEMRVAVVLHEGLHPDVVAVPVGQGYTAYGRYARGTGANPLALLAPLADEQSGALAWAATKVQVKRTGKKADLVRMAHRPKPLPGSEVIRIAKGPKPL
jgi:molybdopterin-containing oxidoreductase family iron-sulfur binding subunit